MIRHWIGVAILLPVGLGSWLGLVVGVAPALRAADKWADSAGRQSGPAPEIRQSATRVDASQGELRSASAGTPAARSASSTVTSAGSAEASAAAPSASVAALAVPTGRLWFRPRSASFDTATRTGIFALVRRLNDEPDRSVRLVGHADASTDGPGAQALAGRRAENVRQFLVTLGVASARIVVSTAAVSSPGAEGAAADRRAVDVHVE